MSDNKKYRVKEAANEVSFKKGYSHYGFTLGLKKYMCP